MLFSEDELDILIPAIDVYLEENLPGFVPRVKAERAEMLSAARDKLDNLTAMTCFSKQEFTLMAAAVHHMIGNDEATLFEYVELQEKLFHLADPEA